LDRFSEGHNCEDLAQSAKDYIQRNFPAVSNEEEFCELPKKHLASFLASEHLHVDSEFQVTE